MYFHFLKIITKPRLLTSFFQQVEIGLLPALLLPFIGIPDQFLKYPLGISRCSGGLSGQAFSMFSRIEIKF